MCQNKGTENCNKGNVCKNYTCSNSGGCGQSNKGNGTTCVNAFCSGDTYYYKDTCQNGSCKDGGTINCNKYDNTCRNGYCSSSGCKISNYASGTTCKTVVVVTSASVRPGTTAISAMAPAAVMRPVPRTVMSSITRVVTGIAATAVRFRTTTPRRSAPMGSPISAVGRHTTSRITATAPARARIRARTTATRWIRPAVTTTATRIRRLAVTARQRLRMSSAKGSTAVAVLRSPRSTATVVVAAATAVAPPTVATPRLRSGAPAVTVSQAAHPTAIAVVAVPASTVSVAPRVDVRALAMTPRTAIPTGALTADQTDASHTAAGSTVTKNTGSHRSADVAHTMHTTTASHTTPATTANSLRTALGSPGGGLRRNTISALFI